MIFSNLLGERRSESTSYKGTIDDSLGEEVEEEEIGSETILEEEEEKINQEDFISYPSLSARGTLPIEILEFEYPFNKMLVWLL